MIRLKHVRFISPEPQETVYVMSDTHVEHPNTNLKLLKSHIDLIKNSECSWIHLGDWVDAIAADDRRSSVEDDRDPVMEAYFKCENMFTPIKDKCIATLRGNHGSKWSKREGDMIRIMAKRWGVNYLGYCGFVTVKLKNKSYKIWLHHGAGGGRKRGAKTIRLNDWGNFVDADIFLQGHTHTYVSFVDEIVTPTRKKLRWFGNTPGYISSYTGHDDYVEELALQPQPAGCIRLTLDKGVKIEAVLE